MLQDIFSKSSHKFSIVSMQFDFHFRQHQFEELIITETERLMDYVAIWTDSFLALCDSFHYGFVQGRWLGTIWAERRQAIRESSWVVVIGPWNLMAKWFNYWPWVRWQRSSSQFCSPDELESGGFTAAFSLPPAGDGDWQGIVEDGDFGGFPFPNSPGVFFLTSPGVAWRLQLGSWDNVVEKAYFFWVRSLVGQQENLSNCAYDFDFLHSLWDWWTWLTCYG